MKSVVSTLSAVLENKWGSKNMKKKITYAKIDYPLMIAVLSLVSLGVVMVYSTSYYNMLAANKADNTILLSSIRYVVVGSVAMIAAMMFDYRKLRKISPAAYVVALVLSVVVLFYGVKLKGGTRWLIIPGIKISFMPSEFAKLAVIICFAWLIAAAGKRIKEFKHFFIMIILLGLICFLTVLQRDLSTTAIILVLGMLMLFIGRCNWVYLALSTALCSVPVFLYALLQNYSSKRVAIWLESVFDRSYAFSLEKYQIIYSIYAIGSGGVFGKGLGMGEMKLLRLPEAYNDFIFAIICEEFGLVGALFVLLLLAFVVYRIFLIALNSKDTFGYMIAAGTGVLIALQVVINIGVVTSILPTTGVTLPFISKGGTSLVTLMFLVGVILNISLHNNLEV